MTDTNVPKINKPTKIIVHHTGGTDSNPAADTSKHTAETIDRYHATRWPGFTSQLYKNKKGEFYHCGYHFVIEKDGTIVQTRGIGEEGAHCVGHNTSSIGIVLTGNFDVTLPTEKQEQAFRVLFSRLGISPNEIFPHRKFATKSCYGKRLSDGHFNRLVKEDAAPPPSVRELQLLTIKLLNEMVTLLTAKRQSLRENGKRN